MWLLKTWLAVDMLVSHTGNIGISSAECLIATPLVLLKLFLLNVTSALDGFLLDVHVLKQLAQNMITSIDYRSLLGPGM